MCFRSGTLDHNRHDKDRGLLSQRLQVNYKQNVQLKLVKVSSTASWGAGGGRGGRRLLAHSKIILKASEVVVLRGSRFETDVWLVNCLLSIGAVSAWRLSLGLDICWQLLRVNFWNCFFFVFLYPVFMQIFFFSNWTIPSSFIRISIDYSLFSNWSVMIVINQ